MDYLIALRIKTFPREQQYPVYHRPHLQSYCHQTTHKRQNLVISLCKLAHSVQDEHELE